MRYYCFLLGCSFSFKNCIAGKELVRWNNTYNKRMKVSSGVNNLTFLIKNTTIFKNKLPPNRGRKMNVRKRASERFVYVQFTYCVQWVKSATSYLLIQLHFFPLFLLPSFPPFCFLPDARPWSRSFRACPFSCFPFVLGLLFLVCSLLLFLALLEIPFVIPLATAPQIALAPR